MIEAPDVLIVVRLALAAVFALAGAAKLADLQGSRRAAADFGLPERLAAPLGVLLPPAELAAACLLAIGATARAGSAIAFVLLLAFSAAIARSIRRGEAPDCHCFGQVHSEPAGPLTLIRNLALAALAAAALFAPWGSGAGIETLGAGGLVALAIAPVLLVLVLRSRAGARGTVAPTETGRVMGSVAPEFEAQTLDGVTVSLASLRASGRPVLIAFTDPRCGPCRRLLPRLGEWQRRHAGALTIAVVSRGEAEEIRHEAAEHGVTDLLQEREQAVSAAYGALATPSAVLVDADGRIASAVVAGEQAIAEVVAGADTSVPFVQLDGVSGDLSRRDALRRFATTAGAATLAAGPASLLLPDLAEAECPNHRRCAGHCCPPNSHCRHGKCHCNPGFTKDGRRCVPDEIGGGGGGSTSPAPSATCGNGIREAGEQCDGANLGGQTCAGLGFASGTLTCNPNCTINTSGCTSAQCSQLSDCPDMTSQCKTATCSSGTCEYADFAGIGDPCTVGTGACQRTGTKVCNGNGGVVCNATPGTPQAEICNGIDDDCDGVVDNDCTGCSDPSFCPGTDTTCAFRTCVGGQCGQGFANGGTPCGTTCSGSTLTSQVCNGSGGCVDGASQSCSPYFCNGNACATTCGSDFDCQAGFHCSGSHCVSNMP
jgi:peroxiredoxin